MEVKRRFRKKTILFLGFATVLVFLLFIGADVANASFAGWFNNSEDIFPYKLQVPIGSLTEVTADNPIGTYISALYKFFVASAGIVAVVAIMFGGLQRVMSQGNPEAISQSTQRIVHAIYGLAIALLSYIILVTINPELVRLDFAVREVNFTANPPTAASTYCPTKMIEANCVSEVTYFRPDPENPSQFCMAVNKADYESACAIYNLAGGSFGEVRTDWLPSASPSSVFGQNLMKTGWGPRDGDDRVPGELGYEENDWSITADPCNDDLLDVCFDEPEKQIPCGQIQDAGIDRLIYGKIHAYKLGVYCGKSAETGYPLSCVIDLDRVDFLGTDGSDVGNVSGITCQKN